MSRAEGNSGTQTRREALNRRLVEAARGVFGRRQQLPPDATLGMRLQHLEQELVEVRSRVNGLFFTVLGALAIELVGRVTQ